MRRSGRLRQKKRVDYNVDRAFKRIAEKAGLTESEVYGDPADESKGHPRGRMAIEFRERPAGHGSNGRRPSTRGKLSGNAPRWQSGPASSGWRVLTPGFETSNPVAALTARLRRLQLGGRRFPASGATCFS